MTFKSLTPCKYLAVLSCIWAQLQILAGVEFSEPTLHSNQAGNLGEQQIVEVVRRWVGPTPGELAPGVIALGSLKERKYFLGDPEEVGGELVETKVGKTDSALLGNRQAPPRRINGWVGPLPEELAPGAIPLGSLSSRQFLPPEKYDKSERDRIDDSQGGEENFLNLTVFTSARPYYTDNVLRQKSDEKDSMVLENALGLSLATRRLAMGQYVTLIPRIDLMLQVASYSNREVKDLLGYGFGMLKGGLTLELPYNFSLSSGIEYNLLHSTSSGDKMFDAWAPSLRLSKIFAPGESTLIMLDASMKFAWTQRVLDISIPDVFADDGDNFQTGVNLTLVQLLDSDGKFMLMPRIGLTRTAYLKNTHKGRVDTLVSAGVGVAWQALDWLSLDLGVGWSALWMNDKGEKLQGESSRFNAIDTGLTILASHVF